MENYLITNSMEMKPILDLESAVIKKEKDSDAEDSDDEDMTFLAKMNDDAKKISTYPILEPIRVDTTLISENAIKLIRTIEKSLANKSECPLVEKAEDLCSSHKIKVEKNNTWNGDKNHADSPEGTKNTIIDPFTGTKIVTIPKYIYGPKPPNKPGLFDCHKCSANFHSLAVLNGHNLSQHVKKIHNSKKPVVCNICDQGFKGFESLVSHRNHKHRMLNPLYESTTSSSDKINENEKLKIKIKSADVWVPDSTIGDGNLGYSASRESDVPPKYIFGPKRPENEGPFSCRKCSINLASKEHLDRHKLEKHISKKYNPKLPHVCNICDKAFESMRRMMHHKIHQHRILNVKYKIYKEQKETRAREKTEEKGFPSCS